MIRINLANRKQAVAVGGEVTKDARTVATELFAGLPIRTIALSALVAWGGGWLLDSTKEDMLKKLEVRGVQATEQNAKYQAELGKTKELEVTKKNLDDYELVIRTKIDVIKKLIEGRQNPPKMLLAISADIPTNVWISEMHVVDDGVSIKGLASDYNQVTDFMKNLGESAYFADLVPTDTQTVKDPQGGDNTSFDLTAKRR